MNKNKMTATERGNHDRIVREILAAREAQSVQWPTLTYHFGSGTEPVSVASRMKACSIESITIAGRTFPAYEQEVRLADEALMNKPEFKVLMDEGDQWWADSAKASIESAFSVYEQAIIDSLKARLGAQIKLAGQTKTITIKGRFGI